ncbi:sensor histidine kinase [Niallia nealsonii]|uniref:histidine kinase n=1 Tax=Niallia nealsonii TaxID=115979 RepID=A0A2N0Z233_9BACI|nr:HAMP domain-containing sensor histidine kinase [Niallia nealsonii]PKG23562.1 sensor histidine kinase [Niallia nealsonii]
MIVGIFIFMIGLIPIVLAIGTFRLFNGSKFSILLLIYMLFISIWQFSVSVLYFPTILSEETALFLFRLFRMGSTFSIAIIFYIVIIILDNNKFDSNVHYFSNKLRRFVFNKKVFYLYIIWSIFIYFINWTSLGIKGLSIVNQETLGLHFYFPVYGSFNSVYLFHMSTLLIFLACLIIIAKRVENRYVQRFLRAYAMYSFLLFFSGFLNFIPQTGILFSSLGIVLFASMIIFEFIKMNVDKTNQYNGLLERQKKLDYAGSLSSSLIHEVKNNVQVIRGFHKLIKENTVLDQKNEEFFDLVDKASYQLKEIVENYSLYMKQAQLTFAMEDVNSLLEEVVEMVNKSAKESRAAIKLYCLQKNIKAYINKPNIQQAFINLIKNSIEAIPPERTTRMILITVGELQENVVITLRDSGTGIEINDLEEVFNPFTTTKEKGMGMGLAFVKKIILEHRGDICIKESSSKGTEFEIVIPLYALAE